MLRELIDSGAKDEWKRFRLFAPTMPQDVNNAMPKAEDPQRSEVRGQKVGGRKFEAPQRRPLFLTSDL
jgi:hypothetical protein